MFEELIKKGKESKETGLVCEVNNIQAEVEYGQD